MPKHGSGRVMVGGRWPDAEKKPLSKEIQRLNKRIDKMAEKEHWWEEKEPEKEPAISEVAADAAPRDGFVGAPESVGQATIRRNQEKSQKAQPAQKTSLWDRYGPHAR